MRASSKRTHRSIRSSSRATRSSSRNNASVFRDQLAVLPEISTAGGEGEGECPRDQHTAAPLPDTGPPVQAREDARALEFREREQHEEEAHGHDLPDGLVFAIEVEAGDLISVPRGTLHWFDLCADRRIRAIRLFQDPSGWTPHYTDSGVDGRHQPLCLGPADLAATP